MTTTLTRRGFVSMLASVPLVSIAAPRIFLPPLRPWVWSSDSYILTLDAPGLLPIILEGCSDGCLDMDKIVLCTDASLPKPRVVMLHSDEEIREFLGL